MSLSNNRCPDIVIIGAMKCGTTSLFNQLRRHDEISASSRKEIGYFSDYWDLGDGWYRRWFRNREGLTIEASTAYSKYPSIKDVPRRMNATNPDVKIVYIIRHPLTRIVSHINYNIRHYQLDRRDVESEEFWVNSANHFIAVSDYYSQLIQYLKFFNLGQILVVKLEDYYENATIQLGRVTNFLGIKPIIDREISKKIYNISWNRVPGKSWLAHKLFTQVEKSGIHRRVPLRLGAKYKPVVLSENVKDIIWSRLEPGLDKLVNELDINHNYTYPQR